MTRQLTAMVCVSVAALVTFHAAAQSPGARDLQKPAAFASIADRAARSRALFGEAGKVITSPRCMNCHPAGDRPMQANDMHPHIPLVVRGVGACRSCHTERNFSINEGASYKSIPGHPRWDLAPIEMAWEGKSLGDICRQLKDPARNGGRSLDLLHEHAAHDDLVAWGWQPGAGRDPAPGTQEIFGDLIRAWIDTGAECPS